MRKGVIMNKLRCEFVLVIIFFAVVYPLFSEKLVAQKQNDADKLVKKESEYTTDTIIVTATRSHCLMSNLPQNVLVLTKKEIMRKSNGDIQSSLTGTLGLDIRSYSFLGSVSSISIWGSTSQQTLILLDGIPINSPSVGIPDLGLYPVGNLERIEIVKGPVSSIYGANALAGVINLITNFPEPVSQYPNALLRFNYGFSNVYTGEAHLIGRVGSLRYQLFGYRLKSSGFRTNDDLLTKGAYFTSAYQLLPYLKFRLDLCYGNKNLGTPGPMPDSSQHPIYGDSTCFSIYDRQIDTLLILKSHVEVKIGSRFTSHIKGAKIINNTFYQWVDQFNSSNISINKDRYHNHNLFLNITNTHILSSPLNLSWGLDLEKKNVLINSSYPPSTQVNAQMNNCGFFNNLVLNLRSATFLSNLRIDYNSAFKNFISYGIGLTKLISTNWKLKTHWGTGFRAPTLSDLYWPNSGNPNLKPEHANTFQIGTEFVLVSNLRFSITGFYRRTHNLISWIPDTNNFWRPTNIDSAQVSGVEFSSVAQIFKNFTFQVGGTIQNPIQIKKELTYYDFITSEARFEYKRRRQAYLPQIIVVGQLNYETNFNTNLSLWARFVSDRVNYYQSYVQLPEIVYETKRLNPYLILSLDITQEIFRKLTLSFHVNNLLNTRYSEQFGNSMIDRDYPQPGRTIFLGVELKS